MVDSAEEHITSRCELNKAGRAVCVRLNCRQSSRMGQRRLDVEMGRVNVDVGRSSCCVCVMVARSWRFHRRPDD